MTKRLINNETKAYIHKFLWTQSDEFDHHFDEFSVINDCVHTLTPDYGQLRSKTTEKRRRRRRLGTRSPGTQGLDVDWRVAASPRRRISNDLRVLTQINRPINCAANTMRYLTTDEQTDGRTDRWTDSCCVIKLPTNCWLPHTPADV